MACQTSAIPGFFGQVFISKDGGTTYNKIGELREMELNVEAELIDATSHDSDGWREFIDGLKNWSITGEALYVKNDIGQSDLYGALIAGTLLQVRFRPKDAVGFDQFSGDCRIASWAQADPNDDAATGNIELTGCGDITKSVIV